MKAEQKGQLTSKSKSTPSGTLKIADSEADSKHQAGSGSVYQEAGRLPTILGRRKESIEGLEHDTREKLTKDLTAQQWNELLSKWYDKEQESLDPKYGFYTMQLSDEKRVMLMREAFEENLHFLFTTMAVHAYTPHSPAVIELLEKGIEKYSEMRHEFLYSMYMLEFPLKKWHFTSSKEDLMVLRQVFDLKCLSQEQVINHLLEVVQKDLIPENDSGSLLRLLMETNLIGKDDFCHRVDIRRRAALEMYGI